MQILGKIFKHAHYIRDDKNLQSIPLGFNTSEAYRKKMAQISIINNSKKEKISNSFIFNLIRQDNHRDLLEDDYVYIFVNLLLSKWFGDRCIATSRIDKVPIIEIGLFDIIREDNISTVRKILKKNTLIELALRSNRIETKNKIEKRYSTQKDYLSFYSNKALVNLDTRQYLHLGVLLTTAVILNNRNINILRLLMPSKNNSITWSNHRIGVVTDNSSILKYYKQIYIPL